MVVVAGLFGISGAGCGDDVVVQFGGGGQGGGQGPVTTATTNTSASTGLPTCANCPPEQPICLDDACAAACPADRAVCATSPGGPQTCCPSGDQCCPGGASGDICASATEGCPVVCPDGSTCPSGNLCQLDVPTNMYGCVDSCLSEMQCGDGICCSLGSRCEGGQCLLADLSIDQARLGTSWYVDRITFSPQSCSLMEGCIGASGPRRLLRFDLATPNTGAGDLFLGDPDDNQDLFVYASCHDHYHFTEYARYTLFDANNQPVGNGQKQAFCLLDYEELGPGSPPPQYHCGYQGISAQWSDVYESSLPCQWIDITGIPAGTYTLYAEVNFDQVLAESDYTNNTASVIVTIEVETCTGCGPDDATCCGDTDTCGWANNGLCDCNGFQPWDAADCTSCGGCTDATTCPGGCTAASDPCCDPANPCGLGQDGICQCAGTQAWDAADCQQCVSADADCAPVDSCPGDCPSNSGSPCCSAGDPCGWSGDGYCDCNGIDWDFMDCSSCACN
jgi:hypothetical protein